MMTAVTLLERWSYIYYADADYGDAMAGAFAAQIAHVARTQRGAAVYRRRGLEGAAHYYFAPGASRVGRRFFARPCAEPMPAQRGELIAGSDAPLESESSKRIRS
jgi:hypothetical protein